MNLLKIWNGILRACNNIKDGEQFTEENIKKREWNMQDHLNSRRPLKYICKNKDILR